MIVIGLNGPAGCGKDAIAGYLSEKYGAVHMEIKELLFEAAIRISGLTREVWFSMYNDRDYKESPNPFLFVNGKSVTMREFMIHVSENVMKPMFGDDVFGKALAQKLKELPEVQPDGKKTIVVLSDGGFVSEGIPVAELVGPENYILARIHRLKEDGEFYDFGKDSRRYISAAEFPRGLRPFDRDFTNKPNNMEGCAEDIMDYVHFKIGGDA